MEVSSSYQSVACVKAEKSGRMRRRMEARFPEAVAAWRTRSSSAALSSVMRAPARTAASMSAASLIDPLTEIRSGGTPPSSAA
jgi:hypothetical protein